MRLRNILVLLALTGFTVGMTSCGKKAEEPKPADSMMTAPPAAPAPAPATTTTTTTTTTTDTAAKKMEAPAKK